MSRLVVLMSTYNGERYLEEQLASIVAQEVVTPRIFVRDDGSTDHTCQILETWKQKTDLDWYQGDNVGPAKSFMALLSDAGEADLYAFSDQDDIWQPEKMRVALEMIGQFHDVPALYFCQTQLVDQDLNPIDSVIINPLLTFGEALVYQFVGGCTMVMNRPLRDILCLYTPDYLNMHDIWIYDVAQAIGAKIVFDPIPHILYRQHGDNVIGQTTSTKAPWKDRFHRLSNHNLYPRSRQAQEIFNGFHDKMPEEHLVILNDFIAGRTHLLKRLKLMTDHRFLCADKGIYRNFQLAALLNIY